LLDRAVIEGEQARVTEPDILRALRIRKADLSLGELWSRLLDADPPDDPADEWTEALHTMTREGPLARRMLALAGEEPSRPDLRRVAEALCSCLSDNRSLTSRDS
ncbi:MAG: hypothetical protein OEO79_15590, partial [Gemmatimonadota bacterium]|nr:hypothetical protein [Gemmatimonadota bacterium]